MLKVVQILTQNLIYYHIEILLSHVLYLTVKSRLKVCALEALSFRITLVFPGDVRNRALRPASLNQIFIERRVNVDFEQRNVKTTFWCQSLHTQHSKN